MSKTVPNLVDRAVERRRLPVVPRADVHDGRVLAELGHEPELSARLSFCCTPLCLDSVLQ